MVDDKVSIRAASGLQFKAKLLLKSGRKLWSTRLEGTPHAEPLALKGLVVVANGKGLLALDRKTGRRLRLFDRGSGATATPVVFGKRLYGLSNTGELVAVDLK